MTSEHEHLDPRQQRTRARVLAAARTVLRREGLGGATIEAIAAEAGVARSTVYRNWSTRDEVLAAAFDDAINPPTAADTTRPVRDQLQRVLEVMATALSRSDWGRTLPAVVAAIDAEPALANRYGRLTEERRTAVAALLRSAVDRGELPAALPVDEFIDAARRSALLPPAHPSGAHRSGVDRSPSRSHAPRLRRRTVTSAGQALADGHALRHPVHVV